MTAGEALHSETVPIDASQLRRMEEEIATRGARIVELEAIIEALTQKRFGRSSEKRDCDGQGLLFEEGVVEAPPAEPEAEEAPPRKSKRPRKRRDAPQAFPEGLERETIEIPLAEDEQNCPCCSKPRVRIGEDTTERLHVIPQRFVVKRYVRGRYACSCKGGGIVQPAAPAGLIDRSRYEASVYALIVASKYLLHLPLYRMESEFRVQGINLRRSTMWNLCERAAELMRPVVAQIEREILGDRYVQLDDSFITVVVPKKKGSRKAHMWVVRSGKKTFYRVTMTRNRERPKELLAGWDGEYMQGDGHPCYEGLAASPTIVRVGCWAHARRLFIRAEKEDPQASAWFIRQFQRLFKIEAALKELRRARKLTDDEFERLRFDVRRRTSRRVMLRIEAKRFELITSELPPLPKIAMGKALSYLSSQREPLHAVLQAGCLELDNNACERDLRHSVIGRKNHQMTSEEKGAEVMSTHFTLAMGCKANGVHFESYLRDVLPRLATTPAKEIASLTPWGWAAAQADTAEAPRA